MVYNLKSILRLNCFLLLYVAADKVPDGGPARDVDLGEGTLNVRDKIRGSDLVNGTVVNDEFLSHLQNLLLGLVGDHLQQTLVGGGESELGSVTHLVNVSEEHHTGLGDDGGLPIDLQDRSDRIDLHGLTIQLAIHRHHLVKQGLPEGS